MDQWAKISARIDEWGAPLRPSQEDVSLFKLKLKFQDKVLLLGVTPELMPLAHVVIDHNPHVIAAHRAQAVLGSWSDLPFESEFDAIIGDGCLTVFQGASSQFFQQAKKAVKKGGIITLRVFISPEKKEDFKEVVRTKEETGFHAFKWRIAQALADPYISVKELYRVILPIWSHPTLDVYRGSDEVYYFPKLSELPPWDQIQFPSTYELAERCPIVTWRV